MNEITSSEYWNEINELADDLCRETFEDCLGDVSAAESQIQDYRLHELVDGHQWVIYNYYNQFVMQHSDNTDYYIDNFGSDDAGNILKERGLSGLHNTLAYFCMYADISDLISDKLEQLNLDSVGWEVNCG